MATGQNLSALRKTTNAGNKMTTQARYIKLHGALDELFANYIVNHPDQTTGFINMPVLELLQWSYAQTKRPSELPLLDPTPTPLNKLRPITDDDIEAGNYKGDDDG